MNHEINNQIAMDIHGEPVEITYDNGETQDAVGIYCPEETEKEHGNQTEFGFIESFDFILSDLSENVDSKTRLVYDGKTYTAMGPCLPIGQGMVSVRLRRHDND